MLHHRIVNPTLAEYACFAVSCALLIFVAGPLFLVFVDENLWWIGTGVFFLYGGTAAVVIAFCVVLAGLIRPIRPALWKALLALTLFVFIMTIFFPHGRDVLDGRPAEGEKWYTLVGTALLFVAALAAAWLYPGTARRIGMVISVMMFVFLAVAIVVIHDPYTVSSEAELASARTTMETAGSQYNAVVLIVDMLQGSILSRALSQDAPAKAPYDGFELFSHAVSAFPMTGFSLPNILSGKFYNESKAKQAEVFSAAVQDSFITDAHSKGFDASTLTFERSLAVGERSNENLISTNYLDIPNDRRERTLYGHLLVIYLERTSKIGFSVWDSLATRLVGAAPLEQLGQQFYGIKLNSQAAFSRWIERLSIGRASRKLFVLHLMFAHAPVTFERDGTFNPALRMTPATVGNEYLHAMDLIAKSLARLKTLGLYDNSLIVIIGDHGHFVSADPGADEPDFSGHIKGSNYRPAGMYNPAILIKRPQSKGPLRVRTAPIALGDVRGILDLYFTDPKRALWSGSALELDDHADRENTIFISRQDVTRRYWYSEGHEPLKFHGNVGSLPNALEQIGTKTP